MNLMVLNKSFEIVSFVDTFESCIWNEKYNEAGDFELYFTASESILATFQNGYYVVNDESEKVMIVETIKTEFDSEGSHITISGRSLESLLDRRVVWGQFTFRGSVQGLAKKLINDNIIAPEDEKRKIENFVFVESEDDKINRVGLDAQYNGDNVYDIIHDACVNNNLGFKIVLDQDNNFCFSLYRGADRSYGQTNNPYVVFSPEFDNLSEINYTNSEQSVKNVCLVIGEGEGSNQKKTYFGESEGIDRKEIFEDRSSLSTTTDSGVISDSDYLRQLQSAARMALNAYKDTTELDGKILNIRSFEFGKDYFLGDIVSVTTDFNADILVRITEFTRSISNDGVNNYPTFVEIEPDYVDNQLLPSNYTECLWLFTPDTASYLDTGVKASDNMSVETYAFNPNQNSYGFMGTMYSDTTDWRFDINNNVLYYDRGSQRTTYSIGRANANRFNHIIATPTSLKIYNNYGEQLYSNDALTQGANVAANNIMLFGVATARNTIQKLSTMIGRTTIKDNGAIRADFIPALDPSGMPCMYDLVTQIPYYTIGTTIPLYGRRGSIKFGDKDFVVDETIVDITSHKGSWDVDSFKINLPSGNNVNSQTLYTTIDVTNISTIRVTYSAYVKTVNGNAGIYLSSKTKADLASSNKPGYYFAYPYYPLTSATYSEYRTGIIGRQGERVDQVVEINVDGYVGLYMLGCGCQFPANSATTGEAFVQITNIEIEESASDRIYLYKNDGTSDTTVFRNVNATSITANKITMGTDSTIFTNIKYDLTQVKSIVITLDVYRSSFGTDSVSQLVISNSILGTVPGYGWSSGYVKSVKNTESASQHAIRSLELDVSDITGEYYIGYGLRGYGSEDILSWYFTK